MKASVKALVVAFLVGLALVAGDAPTPGRPTTRPGRRTARLEAMRTEALRDQMARDRGTSPRSRTRRRPGPRRRRRLPKTPGVPADAST